MTETEQLGPALRPDDIAAGIAKDAQENHTELNRTALILALEQLARGKM
jgi:hypothetical protein